MAGYKRPLLTQQDRSRLSVMISNAQRHVEHDGTPNRAYVKGVQDAFGWLVGEDMSRMLEEVTR